MTYRCLDLVRLIGKTPVQTNWRTVPTHLLMLLFANGTLISVLIVVGDGWRNPVPTRAWGLVPALAMGFIFGELSACVVNVVWGFGSFTARVLLLSAAILIASPLGAVAVRSQPTSSDIRNWIAVLFVYCSTLVFIFFIIRLFGLTAVITDDGQKVARCRWRWSLGQLFSALTSIAVWLGAAVALNPAPDDFRFGAVRCGVMLSLNLAWIPLACAGYWMRTSPRLIFLWLPLALCPIVEFVFERFEIGQADGFTQAWLAPIYFDDDYWPRSGFVSRILLLEVSIAMLSAFFACWRFAGIRFKFQGQTKGSGLIIDDDCGE